MTIYADAHVHFYRCFDLSRLLAAARNRARALDGPLVLLLCESHGYGYFEALARTARGGPANLPANVTPELLAAFPPSTTEEPESLRLGDLLLVAGRQLVSSESIEVLALGADPASRLGDTADGAQPARELVRRSLAAGALAVMPWGVGKWLGERGRRVAELARDPQLAQEPGFFLGDIAQRCFPWPKPRIFSGARVLPGSDILPVAGAEDRLAAWGFAVDAAWDEARPAESLRRALLAGAVPRAYGRREGPIATFAEQLRYRLRGGDA